MNTKAIKCVTTTLMLILIIILLWIFVSYYEKPTTPTYINEVDESTPNPKIEPIIENNPTELGKPDNENTNPTVPEKEIGTEVIISSNLETSNIEKQEVLTEIDGVLMELFEIVDSVQTVDVSRLETEEGKVDEE